MQIYWPQRRRALEISGEPDDPTRRVQRAAAAAEELLASKQAADSALDRQLLADLNALKAELLNKLAVQTSFGRAQSQALADSVDRIIARVSARIVQNTQSAARTMANLGDSYIGEPLQAAGLTLQRALPALDEAVVEAAGANTLDLLSAPMAQYAGQIKVALRRIVLAGEARGVEQEALRKAIEGNHFANAAYRAERIIRTEVSRVFNTASYARLDQVSTDAEFLRKTWGAMMDDRTRLGHVEAAEQYGKGHGIGIKDSFLVRVYRETKAATTLLGTVKMLYPLDPHATPSGELAAGATINCRCHMAIDFAMEDFRNYARNRLQLAFQRGA